MNKYQCILLAAGEGQRAALGYNKVLYKINGVTELIRYSLDYFTKDPLCEKIVIVENERDKLYFKNLIKGLGKNYSDKIHINCLLKF